MRILPNYGQRLVILKMRPNLNSNQNPSVAGRGDMASSNWLCAASGINLLLAFILLMANAFGARHKVEIDPETKAGFMLQQIRQERSAAKKVELMAQFADEFPKDPNLPWVLEQLQPAYLESKTFDKVLALGEKLLGYDPADVDAANNCLKAAEELKDPESIRKFAKVAWDSAEASVQAGKAEGVDRADWDKQVDFCRSVKSYAEYMVFALAPKDDKEKRAEVLKWVEEINPQSMYLKGANQPAPSTFTASAASSAEAVQLAQQMIAAEPNNVDALATLAEHANQINDLGRVLQYTGKLIEVLSGPKPQEISDADWKLRRERYLVSALWLNGINSSLRGNFAQADRSLRAVLPSIRGNAQLLSAGLYHLGYVNYQLAEKGEPNRVFEGLKYFQECSLIRSNYQEQAQKNIAAIKSEFNIQ